MKKLLIPFDFSDYATAALNFATSIIDKTQGEIILLHVIEHPLSSYNISGEAGLDDQIDRSLTLELIKKTKLKLRNLVEQPNYQGKNLHFNIMMGNVYDGISAQIEEFEPDMIIMGTKGATGLKEILVGSNAEKIVRTANCPVITIHKDGTPADIKNIVFPTDLDSNADRILKKFLEYTSLFPATIHLVFVETPHNVSETDFIKNSLKKLADNNQLIDYKIHVTKGFQPEEAILNYAQNIKADMIALSTHGRRGLLHLLAGSIAENLVNHSMIPVWTMTQRKNHTH
ncbi:universal stress protein [Reichenbachiella agarivorans]|uniref:Universal stress protein n=1 Tax=Reichenbachiella agarivorans TaxID=2979464 RepID=A0ABY6CLN4_9BACT|nr:universal stress protein [Reichenbachiella agarivorans]UXP31427.1 universal stress protein [Reichenbachiella agarivorans]